MCLLLLQPAFNDIRSVLCLPSFEHFVVTALGLYYLAGFGVFIDFQFAFFPGSATAGRQGAVSAAWPVLGSAGGHRWQQVQGGQQSRPQLHQRQASAAKEEIESSINRYLTALDTADRQEPAVARVKAERLHDKIETLKAKMQEFKDIEVQLNETPDKQISLTDPDARSMKTRGTGMVGYNVQAAVDAKHHLIVTHAVTNDGVDR